MITWLEVGNSEKRRGWMRPALRQKKGQCVFFRPCLPTALPSPFPSDCPARRERTAIVSLFASTQMFCGPAWPRQKASLNASMRETNRRPFGHGVVTIYSGSYWIINTLDKFPKFY
ncbi:hypothetical protein ACBQ08_12910 [Aneurinibacillus aneurinilyticus]